MNNEVLYNKLNQLLTTIRKENISDNIVNEIRNIFPKNNYKYEDIFNETDFYLENKEIIHLSPNNESKIIISFPEGDLLTSKLSDPNTDIWIEYCDNEHLEKITLFENNHTEEQGLELFNDKLGALVQESKLTKNYVLNYIKESLDKYPPKLPMTLLEKADDQILLDNDIKVAVLSGMKQIAQHDAGEAYEQYMYGEFGGMDVENWKMKPCAQFRLIQLPDNVKKLYEQDIEDTYLKYDGVYDDLKKQVESLRTDIIDQTILQNNKERIFSFLSKRNEIYENHKEFINEFRKNEPMWDEPLSPVAEFIKNIILPRADIDEATITYESQRNRYNLNNKMIATFSSELNDDELNILPHLLKDCKIVADELEALCHDKYNELSNNEFKPWQFIQKRKNEKELYDTISKLEHTKNLSFYLDTRLENESLLSSMKNLESSIEHAKKYNDEIDKLYLEFDNKQIKKIITAISAYPDLAENLAYKPQNYEKILDDYMYDIDILNDRFNSAKHQLTRADEIFSTKEADLLLSKENSNELSYGENEEQEDEGLEL